VNRTVRLVLFVVGATLVALMVWKTGPAALLAVLRTSAWVVAALIPLWAVVYTLNALAWRLLTSKGGTPLPLLHALRITVVAFAVNYATPLMSFGGEPLKIVAATPWLGHRRAVGSVVAYRLLHALAHVVGFLAALVPAAILLPHTPLVAAILIGVGSVLTLIVVFLLSRHREGLAMQLLRLLRRLAPLRRVARKLEPHATAFHEVDEHVTSIYTSAPRRFYGALAVEMLGRVLTLSEYWIILYGMGLGVNPWKALVVASFSSLIVNLFSFLPYELGSKEGGLYFIFQWIGLDPSLGVAASLLSRLRELVWIGIGMGLIWTVGAPRRRAS
jgi:uncharacterized protein (TIRG00374 family)